MSWLGILLIGFAVTDLTHSVRRTSYLPECVGALVALCVGLLAGLTSARDVAALLVIVAVVLVWGLTVTWGFGHPGPKAARLPLGVLAVRALRAPRSPPPAEAPDGEHGRDDGQQGDRDEEPRGAEPALRLADDARVERLHADSGA